MVQWRQVVVRGLKVHWARLTVISISFFAGIWFLSPERILPTSVDWLDVGDLEVAQNVWRYFRNTSLAQWPLAKVPLYGRGWGDLPHASQSGLIFALPFKFMSALLPSNFQYFGILILANFILHGYFSEQLFRKFGLSSWERILGSCALLLAPAFVFRIGMTHPVLSAHWLILAAISVYFSDKGPNRVRLQYLLPVMSLFFGLYLFVMVFAVSLVGLLNGQVSTRSKVMWNSSDLLNVLKLGAASLAVWWAIGYHAFTGSSKGVGFFRLNGLALINPDFGGAQSYSLIIGSIPFVRNRAFFAEEGEGFLFLGIIGIIGALNLVALAIFRQQQQLRVLNWKPLVALSLVFLMFAISHKVVFARREISLPVPQLLVDWRQTFRAATRFGWLPYYLTLIFGWAATSIAVRRTRLRSLLLVLLVLVGFLDQWKGVSEIRKVFDNSSVVSRTLLTSEWRHLGSKVDSMYLVPTFDLQDDDHVPEARYWLDDEKWRGLIRFGAEFNLATNFAYVGRPVTKQVDQANLYLEEAFANQVLPRKSLLFFASEEQWHTAQLALRPGDNSRRLGDYLIIVTGD